MRSPAATCNSMVYLPSRVGSAGESVCHRLQFVGESVCHRLQFVGRVNLPPPAFAGKSFHRLQFSRQAVQLAGASRQPVQQAAASRQPVQLAGTSRQPVQLAGTSRQQSSRLAPAVNQYSWLAPAVNPSSCWRQPTTPSSWLAPAVNPFQLVVGTNRQPVQMVGANQQPVKLAVASRRPVSWLAPAVPSSQPSKRRLWAPINRVQKSHLEDRSLQLVDHSYRRRQRL